MAIPERHRVKGFHYGLAVVVTARPCEVIHSILREANGPLNAAPPLSPCTALILLVDKAKDKPWKR